MASTSQLQIVLTAKDLASKELGKLSSNLKNLQPQFKKIAMIGTASFAAIGTGLFKATQDATNAQEIFNKFEVVFQDVSDQAEATAKDLRDNFGLAESTAKDLLSATGDMLTGFGLSGKSALDLAEKTNKLAVDLASFTNIEGGAERASKALTKALLGERESVKELGIAILEEDVKAKVEAMKAAGAFTDETLREQRALATLEIAISQSKNAIGDFSRTSDSLANQQRVLKERIKETSEELGKVFMPILQDIVTQILPVVNKIGEWIKENPELTKKIALVVLGITALVAVVGTLGLILPAIIAGFGFFGTAITFALGPIGLIIAAIGLLIFAIYKIVKNWDVIKEKTMEVWGQIGDWLTEKFNSIKEKALSIWNSITETIRGIWDSIKNIFETATNFIVGLVAIGFESIGIDIVGVMESIKEKISVALQAIKEVWEFIWNGIFSYFKSKFDMWKKIIEYIAPFVVKIFNIAKELIGNAWKAIWDGIYEITMGAIDKVKEPITKMIDWLTEKIRAIKEKLSAIGGSVGNAFGSVVQIGKEITGLATGGIVTKPTTALIGESGPEAVIPLNKTNGFGNNISITGTFLSEDSAEKVGDLLISRLKLQGAI